MCEQFTTFMLFRFLGRAPVLSVMLLFYWNATLDSAAQVLTVNVGSPFGLTTNVLVAHGQDWNWRRGTNAPPSDWRTASDAALNGTWVSAPGGFGYGDNAIIGAA